VNTGEIELLGEAGITGEALLDAVCAAGPQAALLSSPHPRPRDAAELVAWLADCRRVDACEVAVEVVR
jgi:hypothetical protein